MPRRSSATVDLVRAAAAPASETKLRAVRASSILAELVTNGRAAAVRVAEPSEAEVAELAELACAATLWDS